MLAQSRLSGRRPFSAWPVRNWTRRASWRWVRDTPSRLAAAWAVLDARHHLDRNAGGAAGLDLLVGAAEDHGIAAFEAHHMLAGSWRGRP